MQKSRAIILPLRNRPNNENKQEISFSGLYINWPYMNFADSFSISVLQPGFQILLKWKPGLLIVCTNLQHVIQQNRKAILKSNFVVLKLLDIQGDLSLFGMLKENRKILMENVSKKTAFIFKVFFLALSFFQNYIDIKPSLSNLWRFV